MGSGRNRRCAQQIIEVAGEGKRIAGRPSWQRATRSGRAGLEATSGPPGHNGLKPLFDILPIFLQTLDLLLELRQLPPKPQVGALETSDRLLVGGLLTLEPDSELGGECLFLAAGRRQPLFEPGGPADRGLQLDLKPSRLGRLGINRATLDQVSKIRLPARGSLEEER
jgi:hypothetical protein